MNEIPLLWIDYSKATSISAMLCFRKMTNIKPYLLQKSCQAQQIWHRCCQLFQSFTGDKQDRKWKSDHFSRIYGKWTYTLGADSPSFEGRDARWWVCFSRCHKFHFKQLETPIGSTIDICLHPPHGSHKSLKGSENCLRVSQLIGIRFTYLCGRIREVHRSLTDKHR